MAANQDTTPVTPHQTSHDTKARTLVSVLALADLFSTCVEAFNLIHPPRDASRTERVVVAKLGLQQGRLLIFGDAVGISSPPPTIARHMIPSHPAPTNPDPEVPVNFGVRDLRLDDPSFADKIRAALEDITSRPGHLNREELMDRYGLKASKRMGLADQPSLDTNRLEAFREKHALLYDLAREMGVLPPLKRAMSMTAGHWTIKDASKFETFVSSVKEGIDGLIDLMGVKEQVDKGMRSDIRAMAWHPDLFVPALRSDRDKLRLIKAACAEDYPEYVVVADVALKYIQKELEDMAPPRAQPLPRSSGRRKSLDAGHGRVDEKIDSPRSPDAEKRNTLFSAFSFTWGEKKKKRTNSFPASTENLDPDRRKSEAMPRIESLELERSKSLSDLPPEPKSLS